MKTKHLPTQRLFQLRTILLIVMLVVLGLPLGGLYFFRIYENELVQQTEGELISQAAVLSATFRQRVRGLKDCWACRWAPDLCWIWAAGNSPSVPSRGRPKRPSLLNLKRLWSVTAPVVCVPVTAFRLMRWPPRECL